MSNIDGYYRSAITYTQAPPTTETVSSSFNYSRVENQWGSDLLLYTGLIPASNPLTSAADGDKYSTQGIEIVEKIDKQVLSSVEGSSFAFTQSRLTYIIPGSTFGVTVWSKDQSGNYTVPVPPKFYDIFFYPPAGTYVVYFKEKYAPIYQSDVFDIPSYAPAVTCYRYCGPKGIENTPSQIGVGTYIDGAYSLEPGTGLYSTITEDYKKWIYVEDGDVFVPPGSIADKFTTSSGYSSFQKYVFDFGDSICVGDTMSPYMKKTSDGIAWTDRDLIAEEGYGNTRSGFYIQIDPGTNKVYNSSTYIDGDGGNKIELSSNSASLIQTPNIEGASYVYPGIFALNGVVSFTVEYPGGVFKRLYTTDFVTYNEATIPSGFLDYPGNTSYRILSPDDGIAFSASPVFAPAVCSISTDNGMSWTQFTPPASLDDQSRLVYGDGTYILCRGTANTVYRSTDLSAWSTKSTNFSASSERNTVQSLGSGKWVAFQAGVSTTEISVSTDDGMTWEVVNIPTAGYNYNVIQFGPKYMLFSGADQFVLTLRIFSSTDLESWTLETSFSNGSSGDSRKFYQYDIGDGSYTSLGMRYATFNGKLIIAAGSSIKTYNGTSWSSRTDSWNSFPYGGGLLKIK